MTAPAVPGHRGLRPAVVVLGGVAAVLIAVLLSACAGPQTAPAQGGAPAAETSPATTPVASDATPPSPAAEPVPVAEPVHVRVDAIGVDAGLVPLGLQPDGAMEVPDFGQAGWYAEGPRPGEPGPAVVAAHVDSTSGPDVFFRLRELAAGDQVTVTDASGRDHTFVVDRVEQHPKDALPTEAIWGPTEGAALRLITCGGTFDTSTRHYRDNVIVFADAAVRPAP